VKSLFGRDEEALLHDSILSSQRSFMPLDEEVGTSVAYRFASIKVTLLISRSEVSAALHPVDRATRAGTACLVRFGELANFGAGFFSRMISRIGSVRSSSSWMAVRPRKPVPPHSMQPAPSRNFKALPFVDVETVGVQSSLS
jgi:hypothetical protein